MIQASKKTLLYDPAIGDNNLRSLVLGAIAAAEVDVIDFAAGGDVSRELGIPLLHGMDDIEVTSASLSLRSGRKDLEVQFTPKEPADKNGIILLLSQPARLRKIDLSYTLPAEARVVVRIATPQGSGFAVGPPIFAFPFFNQPQADSMYGPVLAGMAVQDFGSRHVLTLPSVLGSAWLIQLGKGDSADKLAPVSPAVTPTINSVTISALPNNLTVSLNSDGADVSLWNHPALLLSESGVQQVSFLPLAQKHMAKALKSAGPGAVTLPVPLKFHSDTDCSVEVTEKKVEARYVVTPAAAQPPVVQMRGDWTDFKLEAPAGLRIADSTMRITAKLLGRELNGGSPDPPHSPPGAGLRVNTNLSAAVALPFLPPSGTAPGSLLPLMSVRLYLGVLEDAEAVVELRNDAASAPGAIAGPLVSKKLSKGFSGWAEFELQKPLPVSSGGAPLWVSLRANQGELLWFTGDGDDESPPRISGDGRKSWGIPDPLITSIGRPLTQLFHAVEAPPPPLVQVRGPESILVSNLLTGSVPVVGDPLKPPKEYLSDGVALPAAMLSRLASAAGQGRVGTTFKLFSRSALDLQIEVLKLFYDPFDSGQGGA